MLSFHTFYHFYLLIHVWEIFAINIFNIYFIFIVHIFFGVHIAAGGGVICVHVCGVGRFQRKICGCPLSLFIMCVLNTELRLSCLATRAFAL